MTETHPPGEPIAERLAEELPDLLVMDGPRAGQIWTYEAEYGAYMVADAIGRERDDMKCRDAAAVIAHVQCEVVRPVYD
jgi:hypothetical protein